MLTCACNNEGNQFLASASSSLSTASFLEARTCSSQNKNTCLEHEACYCDGARIFSESGQDLKTVLDCYSTPNSECHKSYSYLCLPLSLQTSLTYCLSLHRPTDFHSTDLLLTPYRTSYCTGREGSLARSIAAMASCAGP